MAQEYLDKSSEDKFEKGSKRQQGVELVHFPDQGKDPFFLCLGTGLPLREGIFMDRAFNARVVSSPFIGALLLYNIEKLTQSPVDMDRKLADVLNPKKDDRHMKSMWNRITTNDTKAQREVINPLIRDDAAAGLKGNRGGQGKFLDCLATALAQAPLAFNSSIDDPQPFLPLSMMLDQGWGWDELMPKLNHLIDYARKFEQQWGWHCRDLTRKASDLKEKRKKRRESKTQTYYVEVTGSGAGTVEAFERFADAVARVKQVERAANVSGPWVSQISANHKIIDKNITNDLKFPQECVLVNGRRSISVYRSKELLEKAAKANAPSSSSQLSDD